jgi:hypothetical protein
MKDMTNSAWAAIFIFMACALAESALFSHNSNATMVLTMASSIITGAFGYIQGVKDGKNSLQVPMDQPTTSTTQVTVTPQPDPNAQTK